jgi:hypothetical protein
MEQNTSYRTLVVTAGGQLMNGVTSPVGGAIDHVVAMNLCSITVQHRIRELAIGVY